MANFKVIRDNDYIHLSTSILLDYNLSLRAKGFYAMMFAMQKNNITIDDFQNDYFDKDINAIIGELLYFGYCVKQGNEIIFKENV